MAASYSNDLRDRVLAAYDRGMKTKEIADVFQVSPAWARRVKQTRRQTGRTRPLTPGGRRPSKIDGVRLAELVAHQPDATLKELRERLGVVCSLSAVCNALRRLGLSFEKKSLHAAEQDRPDVAERRAQWVLWRAGIDPRRLIFIDETWAKTNMTRLRGRSPRGQRLVAKAPHGHWNTTTLIGALDVNGVRCSTVVDGPVNRAIFEAFVAQVLGPSLRPGDIVVMDNLSSHKGPQIKRLIESAGAELIYLPPYSPDLSPIEPAFSKVKQLLRSLAARTRDALWSAMQPILDAVTPTDARHFFEHCGYSLRKA